MEASASTLFVPHAEPAIADLIQMRAQYDNIHVVNFNAVDVMNDKAKLADLTTPAVVCIHLAADDTGKSYYSNRTFVAAIKLFTHIIPPP